MCIDRNVLFYSCVCSYVLNEHIMQHAKYFTPSRVIQIKTTRRRVFPKDSSTGGPPQHLQYKEMHHG